MTKRKTIKYIRCSPTTQQYAQQRLSIFASILPLLPFSGHELLKTKNRDKNKHKIPLVQKIHILHTNSTERIVRPLVSDPEFSLYGNLEMHHKASIWTHTYIPVMKIYFKIQEPPQISTQTLHCQKLESTLNSRI